MAQALRLSTNAAGRRHPAAHLRLLEAIADELERRDPDGEGAGHISDPEGAARSTVDSLLVADSFWEQHLGPVYDTEGLRRLLGTRDHLVTRQAVNKRRLLAVKTTSGRVYYPAFQFHGSEPVDGVAEVLRIIDDDAVSRWTLAAWFVSPEAELAGLRPIEVLRAGGIEQVLGIARRWAAALA